MTSHGLNVAVLITQHDPVAPPSAKIVCIWFDLAGKRQARRGFQPITPRPQAVIKVYKSVSACTAAPCVIPYSNVITAATIARNRCNSIGCLLSIRPRRPRRSGHFFCCTGNLSPASPITRRMPKSLKSPLTCLFLRHEILTH